MQPEITSNSLPQTATTRPFQFGLKHLFILTTIVAVLMGLVMIVPYEILLTVFMAVIPMLLITASVLGVIYLRGGRRAFWIGTGTTMLQVLAIAFFFEVFTRFVHFGADLEIILIPLFFLVVPLAGGGIGVYFERVGRAASPPSWPPA